MPQPRERHLAHHGDGHGLQQLGDVGPDDRRPDDHAAVLVDDRTCRARVALGMGGGTREGAEVDVERAGAHPGIRRLSLGQPDRRDLRLGEHHLRHGGVVGGRDVRSPRAVIDVATRGARGDHVACRAGLVLALVREERPVVDVAHRVEPIESGHPHRVVDRDPLARRERHRLEPHVGRARHATGRHEQLVGPHLAGLVALALALAAQHQHAFVALAAHRRDLGAQQHIDARVAERCGDRLAREGLERAEQPRTGDHRDAGAERRERGRQLARHDAPAEDREARGHVGDGRRLAARPRFGVGEARNIGQQRRRSRAHRDRVAGREHALGAIGCLDPHPPFAVEPPVAAHEVDARPLEPADLAGVVPLVHDRVAGAEGGGDVDAAGNGSGRAGHRPRRAESRDRAQQRLRGHARPVRALAADELRLDDHRREPALHGTVGDVLADGAGADHDEVVLRGIHLPSLTRL